MSTSDNRSGGGNLHRELAQAMAACDRNATREAGRQLAEYACQDLKKVLAAFQAQIHAPSDFDEQAWLEDDSVELPLTASAEMQSTWSAILSLKDEWEADLLRIAASLEESAGTGSNVRLSFVSGTWRVYTVSGQVLPSQCPKFERGGVKYALSRGDAALALGSRDLEFGRNVALEIRLLQDEIVVLLSAEAEQSSPYRDECWRLGFRTMETIFGKLWVGLGNSDRQLTGWRQMAADTDCEFLVKPDRLPTHIHFLGKIDGNTRLLQAPLPLGRPQQSSNPQGP